MFIDLAGFILSWRAGNAGKRYPTEAAMRDHLIARGWKTKPSRTKPEGGEITIRTVQEVMATLTDGEDIFPLANLDRIAVNVDKLALPGTEIATVHVDPQDWADFANELRDGWKPTWRERTIRSGED